MEQLENSRSNQGRATIIGNFLARMVDREVSFRSKWPHRKGDVTVGPGRLSGKKLYHFDVVFDDDADTLPITTPMGRRGPTIR